MRIIVVVVTYNRRPLLAQCIEALSNQSLSASTIMIIDNASTDDTEPWYKSSNHIKNEKIIYKKLNLNVGGAGGFSFGLQYALDKEYEWVWLMDDDALPERDALEKLMHHASKTNDIYGSIARDGNSTSWDTTLITTRTPHTTNQLSEIPEVGEVSFLPFLGFLVNTALVQKIGLPDSTFFISGDDLEYCLRAKSSGSRIYVIGNSIVNHPRADIQNFRFLNLSFRNLKIPPWKNYYYVRNKILISKKHQGIKTVTHTLPGIILRTVVNLFYHPNKTKMLYSTFAGVMDGILNLRGRRHQWWKIS